MTRTQIQLPDELYERAKKVCEDREMSFAEFARRGIEYMLSICPDTETQPQAEWEPPTSAGMNLRWASLSDAQLKEIAQESETERQIIEAMKSARGSGS